MPSVGRDRLVSAPYRYFEAVDRKDLDASVAFFAPDATFTIQTAGVKFSGQEEIAGMFRGFFAGYSTICHCITSIVVDARAAKTATEQHCPHVKNDGSLDTLTTCNFFSFAPDGRFRRVVIWLDGHNPLTGEP